MGREVEIKSGKKEELTTHQKRVLEAFSFNKSLMDDLSVLVDHKVLKIGILYIPANHPDRGFMDYGFRIFIETDEGMTYLFHPIGHYISTFLPQESIPEDLRFEQILKELDDMSDAGLIIELKVPEKEGDKKDE